MGDDGRKATEVTMSLDRDELAARLAVADLSNPKFPNALSDREWVDGWANDVAHAADALIARLRPATVAQVADTPEPRRTVGAVVRWCGSMLIVVSSDTESSQRYLDAPESITNGNSAMDDDVFVRWATFDECMRHGIDYVSRPLPGAPPAPPSPAAAPDHPSEARRGQGAEGDQHPAAYVPKVGDVVYVNDRTNAVVYTGYDSRKSPFPHRGVFVHSKIADGWTDGSDFDFVRVATDVDRAIAGLPPITPDHPQGGQGAEAEGRVGDQRVAAGLDAPAKEPAFDETSEREAAVDIAKDRGLDVAEEVGFVAGWLARARIAAKGGAS